MEPGAAVAPAPRPPTLIPTPTPTAAPSPAGGVALAPSLPPDDTTQNPTQSASPASPGSASAGPAGSGAASAALAPKSGDASRRGPRTRNAPSEGGGPQLTTYEGPSPHSFGGEGSRPAGAPQGSEAFDCSTASAAVAGEGARQAAGRAGCGAADAVSTTSGNMTAAMAADAGDGGTGNGHLVAALLATVAVAVLCSIAGAAWFIHSRREGAETAPGIAVREVWQPTLPTQLDRTAPHTSRLLLPRRGIQAQPLTAPIRVRMATGVHRVCMHMQVPPLVPGTLLRKNPSAARSTNSLQDDSGEDDDDDSVGGMTGGRLPKRIPFIHSHLATPAVVTEESTQDSQGSEAGYPLSGSPPQSIPAAGGSTLRPEPYATAEKVSRRNSTERVLYSFPPKPSADKRAAAAQAERGGTAVAADRPNRTRSRGKPRDDALLARRAPSGSSAELSPPEVVAAVPTPEQSDALQRLGSGDTLFQIMEEDEEPDTQSITLAYMPTQRRPAAAVPAGGAATAQRDGGHAQEFSSVRAHTRAQRYVLRTSHRGSGREPQTEPMLRDARAVPSEFAPRSVRSVWADAAPPPPQIVAAEPGRGSVMRAAGGTGDCLPLRQPPPPGSPLQTRMDFVHYQLDISQTSEILEGLVLQNHPQSRLQGGPIRSRRCHPPRGREQMNTATFFVPPCYVSTICWPTAASPCH